MSEHRIRLRGGWERFDSSTGTDPGRRLSLPTAWKPGDQGPARLLRRFGRPPIDASYESIRLELRSVPGLDRVELNGIELRLTSIGLDAWSAPIDLARIARNTLVLDVRIEIDDESGPTGGWGEIAMVIVSKTDLEN